MKILNILKLIFIAIVLTGIIGMTAVYQSMKNEKPFINLPEEYQAISQDSSKPDLLEAYQKNDTIFLGFSPRFQFTKGQILPPDYVHPVSLIVTENFNMPKDAITDEDIWNVLDGHTNIYTSNNAPMNHDYYLDVDSTGYFIYDENHHLTGFFPYGQSHDLDSIIDCDNL